MAAEDLLARGGTLHSIGNKSKYVLQQLHSESRRGALACLGAGSLFNSLAMCVAGNDKSELYFPAAGAC